MSQKKEVHQHFRETLKKKLIPSLAFNWLIPLLLYMLLRYLTTNDATALAFAGAVPAVRTITIWVWRRRVEWIGVIAILGFSGALAVSALAGGSSLPLKLYRPVMTGAAGLCFLISGAIRKPLLITLLRAFKLGDPQRFSKPTVHRKFTIITVVFGLVLLIDAVIHVNMALTLSTGTYLVSSRVVTLAVLTILFCVARWILWRDK